MLQYPFVRDRRRQEGVIADVQDASIVKDLMRPGIVPTTCCTHAQHGWSANLYSSKHSMWPVYLSICNLPPQIRMDEKFQILAGIWYGPKKPSDMALILKPVIVRLNNLLQHGIEAATAVGKKRIKAILLTGIFASS